MLHAISYWIGLDFKTPSEWFEFSMNFSIGFPLNWEYTDI
jgi:hypothetical protein